MKEKKPVKKVFVSGTYDILHAGHIQFFKDARALGDHLSVCFASDEVIRLSKKREAAMPQDNKLVILSELRCVDEAFWSSDIDPVFDFKSHFLRIKPNVLVVTEDDKNAERKRAFCAEHGAEFVVLSKRPGAERQVSTTLIREGIK
ncbi:MAG: hypothetical protein RIT04_117, partial [Candidatus Parcubacteria bacterium]